MKSLTTEDCIRVFGDYHDCILPDGHISQSWQRAILVKLDLPAPLPLSWDLKTNVDVISCHKKVSPWLGNALRDIFQLPDVWDTISDYGGCYNFRIRKGGPSLSLHSWGAAIDINVNKNPFGKKPTSKSMHPEIVSIFTSYGFLWGGTFTGKAVDGMHFEFNDISRL